MRRWMKVLGLAGAVLAPAATQAADHVDGPSVQAAQNPSADINDVFSFMSADNANLTMIMSTGGISAAAFSSGFLYVFHIGRTDMVLGALTAPAASQTRVVCQLDQVSDVSCWVVDDSDSSVLDYASGDATTALVSASSDLRVHAGTHADPFFFHLAGFAGARAAVQAVFASLNLNADGCPDNIETLNVCTGPNVSAGGVVRGLLNGTYSDAACTAGAPNDFFATGNVQALVVELDKTKIAGAGEYFQVWASTHVAN